MQKNELIETVISFCLDYGVLLDKEEIKRKIEAGLEKEEFLENLIGTIRNKAKRDSTLDIQRVKELLIELEKIRLDLEFKDYNAGERTKQNRVYVK
ncbi:MAG: hypothetical protein FWE12_03510 [Oscillospiraceae bacterium]|nr:hypothetical protein [Oscillospiraceae bacterium]